MWGKPQRKREDEVTLLTFPSKENQKQKGRSYRRVLFVQGITTVSVWMTGYQVRWVEIMCGTHLIEVLLL